MIIYIYILVDRRKAMLEKYYPYEYVEDVFCIDYKKKFLIKVIKELYLI